MMKFLFFHDTAPTEIYTLSLHDALPISDSVATMPRHHSSRRWNCRDERSEEHTSELQSRGHLVCRLLLEKKKLSRHINNHLNQRKSISTLSTITRTIIKRLDFSDHLKFT